MKLQNRVSCILCSFNEEPRIRTALEGLVPWADEVIVFDKGSTDGTQAAAKAVSEKVRVVPIPFTDRGCENQAELMREAANDWIYFATCSEVPTRRLVEEMDRILTSQGAQVDVVRVPRKMYSMGAHAAVSTWSISSYPFLVHRQRVLTTGRMHDHFRATARERLATIAYRPDTCVHHYTHSSIDAFVAMHLHYATQEAMSAPPDAHFNRLQDGLKSILFSLCHDRTVQVHGMGYGIYSMLVCLKRYEMDMGGPWQKIYAADAARVLAREWQVKQNPSVRLDTTPLPYESPSRKTWRTKLYRALISKLIRLLVWVAKRAAEHDRKKAATP